MIRIQNSSNPRPRFWSLPLIVILTLFLHACQSPEEELTALFDAWEEQMIEQDPMLATSLGDPRFNDRLADSSLEGVKARAETAARFLDRLDEIRSDPGAMRTLSETDRLNAEILALQLRDQIESVELGDHLLPLNGWWDYHATFAELPNRVPLKTLEDLDNYIARLEQFPAYNQGYIERMREGIRLGVVRPAEVFGDYLASVEAHTAGPPEESGFVVSVDGIDVGAATENADSPDPASADPAATHQTSTHQTTTDSTTTTDPAPQSVLSDRVERMKRVVRDVIYPEYERLATFLREEYIPAAASSPGITNVSGGEAYYDFLIRRYTSLDITANDIHQTGLEEVERILGEMKVIVEEAGFGDDFEGFIEFLRTDPQFYATTPEELMKETAFVLKTMDGHLPRLFKTLPRLPYGIQPVPDYLAPRTTTAYYSRGAADGTRAGYYAVNTYDLKSRPLYEITALSLHEAVPGHHLQIAMQQELDEMPLFRRTGGFTAYVEGWALYSERLGLEVGMYEDIYQNFGRLSYEMWRALRLVVDTGLHAKGWTREQAVEYMADRSALSLHNIRAEVNRYIFWPGQALGYKMGEIAIRRLRADAEQQLGDAFDLREFHDVILLSGSVPLSVLETRVREWVDGQLAS